MENEKSVPCDRSEKKEYVECEMIHALYSFSGDLRCFIDQGVRVGVVPEVLNELEYLISTTDRVYRVVERLTSPNDMDSFPGNSW